MRWICVQTHGVQIESSRPNGLPGYAPILKPHSWLPPTVSELNGARVDGVLNLAWAKIQFPLRATACAFTEVLLLNQSSLRSLELQTTEIKGLQGDGLSVERDLVFSNGFRAGGPVVLRNATIGGSFRANEAHFDRGQSGKRYGQWPHALDLEMLRSPPA